MDRLAGLVPWRGAAWRWLALVVIGMMLAIDLCAPAVRALDCTSLLTMFQEGRSTTEVAEATGLTRNEVASCRQQLRQPVLIGPAGAPPLGAAGPAPRNAAGPPPMGAAGPPPMGAAGPPPIDRDVRRLP